MFVENASHELRTPLTIIRLNLEKLFTHPNNTIINESETIAQALNEAQRLTKLTSDLLLLAKGDSNTLILDKETIDTNTFIHKVLDPFQLLAEEQEKQLIFKENKSFNADIDVAKLHQVLLVLLDNAFKYTKTGDSITVTSSLTNKKQSEVSIKNSEPHINEDKLIIFSLNFTVKMIQETKKLVEMVWGYPLLNRLLKNMEAIYKQKILPLLVYPSPFDCH